MKLGLVHLSHDLWKQRLRMLAFAGILAPVLMAAAGLFVLYVAERPMPNLLRVPGWTAALLGIVTGLGSMLLVAGLYKSHKGFERALRKSGTKVAEDALRTAGYPVMLVVVVAAGIGEELLFRGGLQPIIGLVPAALLFGFSHGGWRKEMWAYAVAATLSGTLFGLAYLWTGDLWVPVIGHALHNVLSTVLLGKKVDLTWEGLFPRVRLLPEDRDDEEEEFPLGGEQSGALAEAPVEVAGAEGEPTEPGEPTADEEPDRRSGAPQD
jgi:membrane protease YdiL (CAAX protease family)